jgi:hypothetical protein
VKIELKLSLIFGISSKIKNTILKIKIEIEYTILFSVCNWNHDFWGKRKSKRSKGLKARIDQRLPIS